MKRHLLILLPVFLFAVVPAFAAQDGKDKNKEKENKHKTAEVQQIQEVSPSPSVAVTQSPTTNCDPNAEWKNHGQYVSCVSHEGRGGQVVSEAARSDVGKKHKNKGPKPSGIPSITPSSTPSGVPSITPSIIPSETPTVSPSAEPSGSPSATPSVSPDGTTVDTAQLQAIITALEGILNFFKNLL